MDTTLRDGTQAVGVNFTLQDKLDIAARLDDFGIDYIEGGFPLASPREADFFRKMRQVSLKNAKLAAFGSTRKPGERAEEDSNLRALLEAETPAVVVVGKGWDSHVSAVVGTTLDENLRMIEDSITFLKNQGCEVILDIEHFFDGWKSNHDYSLQIIQAANNAGADWIVLCDTNGGTLPSEVATVIGNIPRQQLAPLGIHTHNDSACAVASSLVAVENGVSQIHGTINGWGERCGNANICSIIPNLVLKMGYQVSCGTNLESLTGLARYVAGKANIAIDRRSPYIGDFSFAHKAG